jgi:iron(III) transport system permease protein
MTDYAAPPAARIRSGVNTKLNRSLIIQIVVTAVTTILVFAPIVPILYQSIIDRPLYQSDPVLTASNYATLFANPAVWKVAFNSLLFAVLSTVIAQVIGTVLAILIGRTDLPGRRFLGDVILLPMFLSHLVLAFGWFIVYGPSGYVTLLIKTTFGEVPWNLYSLGGMAMIAGISQAPLAFLYCQASTALSDPSLEQAARSCGAGPLRTLWSVTLPMLLPAILSSGILTVTAALEMLAIPLIFGQPAGINLFTTFLYEEGIAKPRPDYGLVGTAAVFLLIIVIALVFLQNRILRNSARFISVTGKASKPRMFELGPYRWIAFIIAALYALLFCAAPILFLLLRALVPVLSPLLPFWNFLTPQFFIEALTVDNYVRSILNTLVISVAGGALGTLLIGMIALVGERSNTWFGAPLRYIALFPRAVPGLVAGLGFFYAMTFLPGSSLLQNSIWLLVIAYVMRHIPTGYGAITPSLNQIAPSIDYAAKVAGADWWTTAHAILLPIMRPALFACFSLLFIQFFKEYTVALFLFSPDTEVIGVTLLRRWGQGEVARVAALSTIQVAITIGFVYVSRRFLGVKFYG